MAMVKNIACIFFIVSAVASMTSAAAVDPPLVDISETWFETHGCPVVGPVKVDCNTCECTKVHSNFAFCTRSLCDSITDDSWSEDKPCSAYESFYSKCRKCTCNEAGTKAVCDDSACGYYPSMNFLNH